MGWLKVDDKLPRNPKILAGDIETAWYYLCALTHCAEQLTDGYIADSAVTLIAPHIDNPRDIADRCCELELLSRTDGGYLIRDYLDFNPARAKVLADRKADKERQARHRASRQVSQRDSRETSDVSPAVPSRPVLEHSSHRLQTGSTREPDPPADDQKLQQVIDHVIATRARGQERTPGWKRTVRRNLRTDDGGAWWQTLLQLMADHPDAPVSMLAAAAEGEPTPHLHHHRLREASA